MQQRKYFKTIVVAPALLLAVALVGTAMRKPAAGRAEGDVMMKGLRRGPVTMERGDAMTWMTVEQAVSKLQQEKRPVLIDLYTTWCGWCKEMDRKTYSNKNVAGYLRDKYYSVKVDAETHEVINWQGRAYSFNPQYRSNEFALYLTHGQLEFPTTIIIPPGEAPQAIPGYLEPKELELLVKYFGDGAYKSEGFDVYQKRFKGSW